ncbi:serine protease hepsin-like isoform X1 [Acropora palmata]|uniref:serine protease hepsin-like isoform X1 n=1 Tax=Acropora palmata TaxID=6131 RepID=UPI003DA0DCCC
MSAAFPTAILLFLQSFLFLTVLVVCSVDVCPSTVRPPREGDCKIECLLNSNCHKWQYCCKVGCWQTCVNYTLCQLKKIEASLSRSSFTPTCKADGSFQEIQCQINPVLKCWKVDREGKKIQDLDATIKVTEPIGRQSLEAKEKKKNTEHQSSFWEEEDEIDGESVPQQKTPCELARERKLTRRQKRPGTFVPKCKSNGEFRLKQCHKKTKYCWCVDREGRRIPGTKSKEKKLNCRKVSNDCGKRHVLYPFMRRSRRIVGGLESVPNSWPWMIALFFNGTRLGCGGSIIKSSWVVTAAHCFNDLTSKNPADWEVWVGEHSFKRTSGIERKIPVKQIIIHPNYRPSNSSHPGNNDIALLRLPSSLHFDRVIHQICLPESYSFFNPGKRCIVTGWGHTAWKGNSSNVLREAWVDLISKPDCNYENSYNGTIGPNFLCAGYKEGGTDACYYDSGGPLACPIQGGRWVLAGIVSWGERCAQPHKYGVYTNVYRYIQWMSRVMRLDR